jgi:hypothetical protein
VTLTVTVDGVGVGVDRGRQRPGAVEGHVGGAAVEGDGGDRGDPVDVEDDAGDVEDP